MNTAVLADDAFDVGYHSFSCICFLPYIIQHLLAQVRTDFFKVIERI